MILRMLNYMTKGPHSMAPDETLATAKSRMEQFGIRYLPVIDGSRLVGVISSRDLFLLDALKERSVHLVKVGDVMTEQPYAVTPQTPISQVATEMANLRIRLRRRSRWPSGRWSLHHRRRAARPRRPVPQLASRRIAP
jgi:CBS domain-containing protein